MINFSSGTIKLIGAQHLQGAIGLIVPLLTGIPPWLTPLAAIGPALTMAGAMVVPNAVLLLAASVAFGR